MEKKSGKYWNSASLTKQEGYATITGSSTGALSHFIAPYKVKIIKCSISVDSAITGAVTDNCILGFNKYKSGGTSIGSIASKTFSSGVDATAYAETDLGALTNNVLAEGDVVVFAKTVNGGGATMPALLAKIEYVRV